MGLAAHGGLSLGCSAVGNIMGHPLILFIATEDAGDKPPGSGALRGALATFAAAHVMVALAAAAAPDSCDEAARPALGEVFRRLRRILSTSQTRRIGASCLLQRIGVAVVDSCTEVVYMRLDGAQPAHLGYFAALLAPVAIAAAVVSAQVIGSAHGAEGAARLRRMLLWAYALLLLCGVAVPVALGVHRVGSVKGRLLLLGVATLLAAANKLWWTAQGALFATLVAPSGEQAREQLRATHLTLLNSLSNVGKFWPKPVALVATETLGYGTASALSVGLGVAAWPLMVALIPGAEGGEGIAAAGPGAGAGAAAGAKAGKAWPSLRGMQSRSRLWSR